MHNVLIKSKNQVVKVENDEVIYDALDAQGIELPHGCLAGSCGACRIEVYSGMENLKDPSTIELNTIEAIKLNKPHLNGKNIRLSCRAKVQGDVEIDPVS